MANKIYMIDLSDIKSCLTLSNIDEEDKLQCSSFLRKILIDLQLRNKISKNLKIFISLIDNSISAEVYTNKNLIYEYGNKFFDKNNKFFENIISKI